MTRALFFSLRMALADYAHEKLLSACAVLGLAAVLTPLLVLFGVRHGIISTMTERLTRDPRTLELVPVGSGHYGPEWFAKTAELPGVAFVVPQTRTIAATLDLRAENGQRATVDLIPTAAGDPVLARWNAALPSGDEPSYAPAPLALPVPVVLAENAARKLGVKAGDTLTASAGRTLDGRRESASLPLRVAALLPLEAQQKEAAYVPLALLVATEDYRDGRAVPALNWPGEEPPQGPREYPSFRLYAAALDDVGRLRDVFAAQGLDLYTQAEAIETVKSLDRAFTLVFALISGAALFGFAASTASSALAGVRRKSRSLGILRLMGLPRSGIVLFPVAQALLNGLLGTLLAFCFYYLVAVSIDRLFAASLPGGEAVCVLLWRHAAASLAAVLGLSAFSALGAAWRAASIEPSEVIRDV